MTKQNRGTHTSAFGSPGRVSHDSSLFYASKLYDGLPTERQVEYKENSLLPESLDQIFCTSAEQMTAIPDQSIHLMVTSPPYNVGKSYDENLSLGEYLGFLKKVWKEVFRVLVPGGRACINVANLGRKPYIPLHALIIEDILELGFLMRGEIIWDKAASASASTAWGSWCSASNPSLRDVHEYILIFSKYTFQRKNIFKRENSITKEDFLTWTKSIWAFPAVSARQIGHPAPYPIDLPYRLIQLYTYKDEIVLDPFMGSGQTALAALKASRQYVGYEVNEEYVQMALRRIAEFQRDN
ncbi:MAG: site-specific DNA-methyltransferase [Anaerolineales bacterium]|nr:site-specific DNA-methyltransferase [Anaerolineales bacterium]